MRAPLRAWCKKGVAFNPLTGIGLPEQAGHGRWKESAKKKPLAQR